VKKCYSGATNGKNERLIKLECSALAYFLGQFYGTACMRGILIAIATIVLGTMAYVLVGMALASVG
jgi:hypothetical protein